MNEREWVSERVSEVDRENFSFQLTDCVFFLFRAVQKKNPKIAKQNSLWFFALLRFFFTRFRS